MGCQYNVYQLLPFCWCVRVVDLSILTFLSEVCGVVSRKYPSRSTNCEALRPYSGRSAHSVHRSSSRQLCSSGLEFLAEDHWTLRYTKILHKCTLFNTACTFCKLYTKAKWNNHCFSWATDPQKKPRYKIFFAVLTGFFQGFKEATEPIKNIFYPTYLSNHFSLNCGEKTFNILFFA